MKERIRVWFLIPFMVVSAFLFNFVFDVEILLLNQQIIDYVPYPDSITCVGCCTVRCLEFQLLDTIKKKFILPFFMVGVIIVFVIVNIIVSYLEIKKEKEGLD